MVRKEPFELFQLLEVFVSKFIGVIRCLGSGKKRKIDCDLQANIL